MIEQNENESDINGMSQQDPLKFKMIMVSQRLLKRNN